MVSRRLQLILGNILLIVVIAACALSPASTQSVSTSAPAGNTALPAQPESTPTIPAPTQPAPASAAGGCANAYFPVSSGNSWSYASSGNNLGAYTYTWTVASVSDTGFSTRDQYSTGVNAVIKWKCHDGNLAALDAGSNSLILTTSKVKVTSTSIAAEGYNVPTSFETGKTWSEKLTIGSEITSGTRVVNSQIVEQFNCSAAGADSVTVPAGTFNAVKTTCAETMIVSALMQGTAVPAGTTVNVSITDWYAKGVGLVKSVRTGSTSGTETIVLTQYDVK